METIRPDLQNSRSMELQALQELVDPDLPEIIQACGECLQQLASIPRRRKDYDYESFSVADRSETLEAAEKRIRQLDTETMKPARNIPSRRTKLLVPDFLARQQAIEEGRRIVPEWRATFERGLERCQLDSKVAGELIKEAATSITQLTREDIAYIPVAQRSDLIAELVDAAEQLAEGDLKLPWRTPIQSLRSCLDFEVQIIYKEIGDLVGNVQFAKRVEAELRRRVLHGEFMASILAGNDRMLQFFNNTYERKRAATTRQHHRSPSQLVEAARTIDQLQSEVQVSAAQCQTAFTELDNLTSLWMSQLSSELVSSVKYAESQLAIWQDILASGESDLDPAELNSSVENALAFIAAAKEHYAAFLPSHEAFPIDEALDTTSDGNQPAGLPETVGVSTTAVQSTEKEPLDPELEKALRLGARILNGGGKLEKSTRCKQLASELATIKVEIGKQRKTVESLFRKYECGVVVAILTDNFDQFKQFVDQVQSAWQSGHDYAKEAGMEWIPDIRTLQTINIQSVANNIKTIVESTGTRNRLLGILSDTELTKLIDKLKDITQVNT